MIVNFILYLFFKEVKEMLKMVTKSPGVVGLMAIAGFAYAVASVMEKFGLFTLAADGSLPFILAVACMATIFIGCGIVGCVQAHNDVKEKEAEKRDLKDLKKEIRSLRTENQSLLGAVQKLAEKAELDLSEVLSSDPNNDETAVELDPEAENTFSHGTTTKTVNGSGVKTPLLHGQRQGIHFAHQPGGVPTNQSQTSTHTPTPTSTFRH